MASDPDHEALVHRLCERGAIRSKGVREAMLAVDRRQYLPPDASPQAYDDAPVLLKVDADGRPASTASQPTIVALMLEELATTVGDTVLEIGTACGYNASLLAQLVGPTGAVFSIEVDQELAAAAKDRLSYNSLITVAAGDGRNGFEKAAPTTGSW